MGNEARRLTGFSWATYEKCKGVIRGQKLGRLPPPGARKGRTSETRYIMTWIIRCLTGKGKYKTTYTPQVTRLTACPHIQRACMPTATCATASKRQGLNFRVVFVPGMHRQSLRRLRAPGDNAYHRLRYHLNSHAVRRK